MTERVSNECARRVFAHGEAGLDENVVLVDFASDLLDARAEIVVATKELTRLSVEIVRAGRERDEASLVLQAARELRRLALDQRSEKGTVLAAVVGVTVAIANYDDAARAATKGGGDG